MERPTFNWGTGIAIAYTAFALATAGFAAFAMSRPVDLVSQDYYRQSLRLDQRMRAERNARGLQPAPTIVQQNERLVRWTLPPHQIPKAHGTITLYRAADARADRVIDVAPDASGRQDIPLRGLAPGSWIVRVQWTVDGVDYYLERAVVAP
jgi:hypothetical protein